MLNKLALFVSIVVLSLFYYYVYVLNVDYEKENFIREIDNGLLFTKNLFEEEQRYALTISTLISQDAEFLKAYSEDDRKKTFDIVNRKIKDLSYLDGAKIEVQVHDKNANTYLRSWDFEVKDIPLSSFREGLVLVSKTKKRVVSVEVGKRLNIKAISPILQENELRGSIEVIIGFEHLQNKLLAQGYTMLILLDKKYLDIATELKDNPIIKDKFVLVNEVDDEQAISYLLNCDLSVLGSYGYFQNKNASFGYFGLNNLHNERIGYCVLALKSQNSSPLKKHYLEHKIEQDIQGVIIR